VPNVENDDVLSSPETFELSEKTTSKDIYFGKSIEELYQLLNEAVQNEDYEKAAKIRDVISKKES
jgi:protein-arginine kinase activator protein McsA